MYRVKICNRVYVIWLKYVIGVTMDNACLFLF